MKRPKPKPWKKRRKSRGKRRPRRSDPLGQLAAYRSRTKRLRPNPACPAVGMFPPSEAPIFEDPIFLHHVSSAILRYLELKDLVKQIWGYEDDARETMAEFDKRHREENPE